MADGSVYQLVRGVLEPADRFLDYLFCAGVVCGLRGTARLLYQSYRGFRTYFTFGGTNGMKLAEKYGKWAVITGGTSAIGLAYAHEFARRSINVVLISRSYDELVNAIGELQALYEGVRTYGIYADFSLGARVYQDVEDTLKELDIGILVNNVSLRYDHPQYFSLIPHQCMWQVVDVNVMAITVMTHMILPQMLQRQRGAIINVSSLSACTPPLPLTAEYTASMAYVDSFSQALHYENRHKGICVQTLLPCFITMPGSSPPTLFSPYPETYVRHALASLGVSHRSCGYWPHAVQSWLCCLIPEWLWVRLTMYYNTVARRCCIADARDNGVTTFSRMTSYLPRVGGAGRHGSSSSSGIGASGRQSMGLAFRRTSSPHTHKMSADMRETSPITQRRKMSADMRETSPITKRRQVSSSVPGGRIPKISSEENMPISSSSHNSSGEYPIPSIQEVASPSTTPPSTPKAGQTASLFLPRSGNISMAQTRIGSTKKHRSSKVIVMPSMARTSHLMGTSSPQLL